MLCDKIYFGILSAMLLVVCTNQLNDFEFYRGVEKKKKN